MRVTYFRPSTARPAPLGHTHRRGSTRNPPPLRLLWLSTCPPESLPAPRHPATPPPRRPAAPPPRHPTTPPPRRTSTEHSRSARARGLRQAKSRSSRLNCEFSWGTSASTAGHLSCHSRGLGRGSAASAGLAMTTGHLAFSMQPDAWPPVAARGGAFCTPGLPAPPPRVCVCVGSQGMSTSFRCVRRLPGRLPPL